MHAARLKVAGHVTLRFPCHVKIAMATELARVAKPRPTVEVREGRRMSLARIADRGISLGELKELQQESLSSETRNWASSLSKARTRNLYELMDETQLYGFTVMSLRTWC